MFHKLDFLVRFWELSARHASEGQPLAQDEQRELLSLLQLVTPDLKIPAPGAAPRDASSFPAQMIGEGIAQTIALRNVTAAALVATSAITVPHGVQVILRATDAVAGVEYALPCKVLWVYPGAPNTIALMVDGVPSRTRFVDEVEADADADVDDAAETPRVPRATAAWRVRAARYDRLLTWSTSRRSSAARRQ